jgi:hypothetical protein
MHGTALHIRRDAPQELVIEHGVLLRQIGGLQRRSSELQQAAAVREATLQAENLRLRAELVLLRTSVFWGLGAATVKRRPAAARPPIPSDHAHQAPEAQAVICQTGCVGHAHPWLESDGQCRRSGQPCERQGLPRPPQPV